MGEIAKIDAKLIHRASLRCRAELESALAAVLHPHLAKQRTIWLELGCSQLDSSSRDHIERRHESQQGSLGEGCPLIRGISRDRRTADSVKDTALMRTCAQGHSSHVGPCIK